MSTELLKPVFWSSYSEAIKDPLFNQARGIMGTENIGQDESLMRAINHVFASIQLQDKTK